MREIRHQFWKCRECEGGGGSKYQDTGLAFYVKLYYVRSKTTFPSKEGKRIHFGGSLSGTKCYPYKARSRNLSAISPTRNICSVHVRTYGYAYSRNLEK